MDKDGFKAQHIISLVDKVSAISANKKLVYCYITEEEKEYYYKLFGDAIDYIKMTKILKCR